jgi:hypothetical protein
VVQTWIFPALFLIAGIALIRSTRQRALIVLWLTAVGLYAIEAYTSGIAWMLNHMAPGAVLAGVWAVAALFATWPRLVESHDAVAGSTVLRLGRAAALSAIIMLALGGAGAIRRPERGLPPDADRYRRDLERAVAETFSRGGRVLLDHGTWVYLPRNETVGDRSAAAGELGASGKGDFSGFLGRIRSRYYDRIIVRDFLAPNFFYDYHLWDRSSGIRAALLEHYRVVATIPAMKGENDAYFKEVSVLEPKSNSPADAVMPNGAAADAATPAGRPPAARRD